jgi:DNA-binding NtrC family response regulator
VVDDEASQRDISCRMLEVLGYRPQAVSSGEDAVAYLQTHTVDLVLLDMIMDPGMNGRQTYEQIVHIHPRQKAIIISGFAETEDVLEAQRMGAGQFLKKPVTLEKLGRAVKQELEK